MDDRGAAMSTQKNMTISDIAEELGVSKTTVSRVLSGKGRIGEETRTRVLNYIKDINYKPNLIAKSLAQSKTYNIGVVLPADSSKEVPFFQTCLMGVCEVVNVQNYDVIAAVVTENDISQLVRLVENQKVDGVVLTRSFVNDLSVHYLKEKNIPFVLIGSSSEEGVVEIDSDHVNACSELTSYLMAPKCHTIAYFTVSQQHMVEQKRYRGYCDAFEQKHQEVDKSLVFHNLTTKALTEQAVETGLSRGVDCIICSDDRLCSWVLSIFHQMNISVPKDVMLASFYNSSYLENYSPAITAIDFDAKDLGYMAGKQILKLLNHDEVSKRMLLSYKIMMNQSTQR